MKAISSKKENNVTQANSHQENEVNEGGRLPKQSPKGEREGEGVRAGC